MSFDLEKFDQWITWDYENGNKIPKKINGGNAKSNDSATWSRFADVYHLERKAFVFSADDPFFGIDLDDSINAQGVLTPEASEIVQQFRNKALIEISPSKTGFKITAAGKKPTDSRCVYWHGQQKIEIYDKARFWTITQEPLFKQDAQRIDDCQAELDWVIEKLSKDFWQQKSTQPAYAHFSYSGDSEIELRAKRYLEKIPVPKKGTINDTLFSVCGHLHSFRTIDHLALSPKQIFELVWSWCAGCDPGLTQDYLWDRVESSSKCGTARQLKYPDTNFAGLDTSEIISIHLDSDDEKESASDEEIAQSLVPRDGIIREVFDYYWQLSTAPNAIMGLATSMAIVETIYGQRLQTQTGLRSNDFNVILAATGTGKESCEKTVAKILSAINYDEMIMPSGVQSGNGLLNFLSGQSVAIWVKDEFGVYLESVFGKRKNPMESQVGRFLLELYNKSDSRYSGNAHASGVKHVIEQPHLVLLGLSTQGTIFDSLTFKDVENGLLNRIAWWIVTDNPPLKDDLEIVEPSERLLSTVRSWLEFRIEDNGKPNPVIFRMTPEAKDRWDAHRKLISLKKEDEETARSAMWSRTAARSLKFALCSRASRLFGPQAISEFSQPQIELCDLDWGIALSNWLTRSACDLITANLSDTSQGRAEMAILKVVADIEGWAGLRDISRKTKISAGDLRQAAKRLAKAGRIELDARKYGTKQRFLVRRPNAS